MRFHHLLLAVLVAFSAGITYAIVKIGVAHFPPVLFGAVRYMLVGVCLAAWWWVPEGRRRPVIGIAVSMTAQYVLMFSSLSKSADASSMALVHQLYVAFATIIAAVVYREAVGARRWIGMAVSFSGVIVIGFEPNVFRQLDAFFLAIAAAFAGGLCVVQARRTAGISVLSLQFWVCLYGVVPMFLLTMATEEGQIEALLNPTWPAVLSVVFAGLFGAVLAQAGRYYLVQRYPVSMVAPLMLLTPVFAVLGGVVLLGDVITWRLLLGGILVISGLGVIVLAPAGRVAASMTVGESVPGGQTTTNDKREV